MALPGRTFDCFTPWQYFCLRQSLSIPLFVAVTGSSFVCGSPWQYFLVLHSFCGCRGVSCGSLYPAPPLRLKIIFIKMSVYIKINYQSEPSSIKFEPPFKNSPAAPLIVTLPGCTFGCDTLIANTHMCLLYDISIVFNSVPLSLDFTVEGPRP